MPAPSEAVPETGFDPLLFWDQHKNKIVLYAGLLVFALVGYAIFQIATHRKIANAERMFALADSVEEFRQIAEKFPKTVVAGNAFLELGAALREEQKYDESAAALRRFVDDYPEHPLVSSGWVSLAATLETQGKSDEALDIYRQVATRYPASHEAPLAMISQANILRAKGKTDEAKSAYEAVISQFQNSYYAQVAMQELRALAPPAGK